MNLDKETWRLVEQLAKQERRSLANMAEVLLYEALKARGLIAE